MSLVRASGRQRPTITLAGQRWPQRERGSPNLACAPDHRPVPELTAEENSVSSANSRACAPGPESCAPMTAFTAAQLEDRRRSLVKNVLRRHAAPAQTWSPRSSPAEVSAVRRADLGVDPQSRNAIFEHLQQLNRAGITIIYSTHYMEEAEATVVRASASSTMAGSSRWARSMICSPDCHSRTKSPSQRPATAPLMAQLTAVGEVTTVDAPIDSVRDPAIRVASLGSRNRSPPAAPLRQPAPHARSAFLHLTGRKLRDA